MKHQNNNGAANMTMTTDHVAAVAARLREEWGIGIASIPVNALRIQIGFTEEDRTLYGDIVTVKIPSRSEFDMTLAEAHAVLRALTGR